MVNTVGSYETKRWHKKWKKIKQNLILTQGHKDLIIGSLLGDGTMRIPKGGRNANFKVEHGLVQKEYVFWKYQILKSFVSTGPKLSFRYRDEDRERYEKSWWFRTLSHPLLTEIHQRFYKSNSYDGVKKIVPPDIEKDLNSLSMAVWVMDDGSHSRDKIDLSTYAFSRDEIEILEKAILNKFGIRSRHHKDRDKGLRMYFSKSETQKLIDLISPHIIPLMMYKIGFRNPVTTGSL